MRRPPSFFLTSTTGEANCEDDGTTIPSCDSLATSSDMTCCIAGDTLRGACDFGVAPGSNSIDIPGTAAGQEGSSSNRSWYSSSNASMSADRKSTTSELQSLMRISYAVFCLKKKTLTQ